MVQQREAEAKAVAEARARAEEQEAKRNMRREQLAQRRQMKMEAAEAQEWSPNQLHGRQEECGFSKWKSLGHQGK